MPLISRILLAALLVLAQCGPVRIGRQSLAAPAARPTGAPAAATAADDDPPAPDLRCAPAALTCVRITGQSAAERPIPATFGMPFAPGQVPAGRTLEAEADGRGLKLQMDEPSSYPDGSLRFAIFSLVLPRGASGAVVSLMAGPAATGAPVDATEWQRAGHDVTIALDLASPQISTITLGNRQGHEPGTPFNPGDAITARLGNQAVTIHVSEQTAGGGFHTLSLLSRELADAINRDGHFRAFKIGEGGGYETLWVTAPGGAFPVGVDTTGQAPVRADIVQHFEPSRRYTASARAMLAAGPRPWLAGPVAGEILLSGPLRAEDGSPHPRLTARIDLRRYAGLDQARADVSVEDLWTYDPGPRNWHYDVAIAEDGRTAFSQMDVTHYHHARWHKVIWSANDPAVSVAYERHHLLASGAVQHYDEHLGIPDSVISADVAALRRADTGLMGAGMVTPYFGTTGGRADIGPLPRWTTIYLLSMDPRERSVMLANADVSGSIPIHYRDRRTDLPVSLDIHPGIVTGSWPPSSGPDKVPDVSNGETPWQPDDAHQPSLVYVPYMITGDRYYLEEVQFWADWNMGQVDVGKRQGAKGLVIDVGQTRGEAWALRALADAAEITPDSDPMKRYFEEKLANNLAYARSLYARRSNPVGLDVITSGNSRMAPWQVDFVVLAMGQIAAAGYPNAGDLLDWLAVPALGLWTNEQNGFCRMDAPTAWLEIRRPDGNLVTSWSELRRVNFPSEVSCPSSFPKEAYDTSAGGYVANAMAAAAVLSDRAVPGARSLFDSLDHTSRMNFSQDPVWRIVPRGP